MFTLWVKWYGEEYKRFKCYSSPDEANEAGERMNTKALELVRPRELKFCVIEGDANPNQVAVEE